MKIEWNRFVEFAKNNFNFEPKDIQIQFLKHMLRGENVWTARGIGRTTLVGAFGCFLGIEMKNLCEATRFVCKNAENDYSKAPDFKVTCSDAIDCGLSSPAFIESERKQLPPEIFDIEYGCIYKEKENHGERTF